MSSPYTETFPADVFVYAVDDGMRTRILEATEAAVRKGRYRVEISCDDANDAKHVEEACKRWKCPGLEERIANVSVYFVYFNLPVPTDAELERYRATKHAEHLFYQKQNQAVQQKYRPHVPDDGDGVALRAPPCTQRDNAEEKHESDEEYEDEDGEDGEAAPAEAATDPFAV